MEQGNSWFPEPNEKEPESLSAAMVNVTEVSQAREDILRYVRNSALCYSTEIADALGIDTRTVTKWLKRLIKEGKVVRADMNLRPTVEQATRIAELRSGGMKRNNFKNAKWYCISQGENDE